jgi:hypothetical protein
MAPPRALAAAAARLDRAESAGAERHDVAPARRQWDELRDGLPQRHASPRSHFI